MTITSFDLRRLPSIKIHGILDALDIPRKMRISKTKPERITMLMGLQEADSERFLKAYNVIVHGIIDEPVSSDPAQFDEARVREIVSEEFMSHLTGERQQQLIKTLTRAIEESAASIRSGAIKEAKAILMDEANKYRKVEVVMPGAKSGVKMKFTMPEQFDDIIQRAAMGLNVLLVGPSGCGKTFISEQVAVSLGRKFASISCSAGMSEAMLTGWLIPTGQGGKFEYVTSQFVEKYENGGVFLLDEVDAADPNTMVFINQAIAQDHFFIAQRYDKPLVKKHKDFVLIAAANTFGNGADMMFVGRNQLDAATLDRFRAGIIMMDYSPAVESATVNPEVLSWGLNIREKIKAHKMRRVMSTRFLQDLTKMSENCGWDKTKWEKVYFTDWTDQERNKVLNHGGD